MIFIIKSEKSVDFPDDFSDLIPESYTGKVLNYGQGEGQVQIGETVWGFYYGKSDPIIQFEEGVLEWESFVKMTAVLKEHLAGVMNCSINLILKGEFSRTEDGK